MYGATRYWSIGGYFESNSISPQILFQYFFEIKLNGVRKWKVQNTSPRTFRRVEFWAAEASHGFPPANAIIKNLVYENIGIQNTNGLMD